MGKIEEIIESGQAPAQTGKKKTYAVDHKVIWDADKNKALELNHEGFNEKGRRLVSTSDTGTQKKMAKLGYDEKKDNKLMHRAGQVKPESIRKKPKEDPDAPVSF